jgi:hypothetical protein
VSNLFKPGDRIEVLANPCSTEVVARGVFVRYGTQTSYPDMHILLDDMPHETVYMTNVMNQRGFRAEMSLPAAYDEALRGVRAFSAGQRNR